VASACVPVDGIYDRGRTGGRTGAWPGGVHASRVGGRQPDGATGHHTLDSSHIAFGVVTAAVDHGPWVLEGSVFNGREPDENRWDMDLVRWIRFPDGCGSI
jgi:hypothetical protein